MLLVVLLVLASVTTASAQTATPDSSGAAPPAPAARSLWLPTAEEGSIFREDRFQHATLSASLVIGATSAGAHDGPAAAGVLACAALKEWLDYRHGTGASRLDLVADVIGVAAGLLIVRTTR
jgi:uncharacterized protein YfiM (DUF2279 family)